MNKWHFLECSAAWPERASWIPTPSRCNFPLQFLEFNSSLTKILYLTNRLLEPWFLIKYSSEFLFH